MAPNGSAPKTKIDSFLLDVFVVAAAATGSAFLHAALWSALSHFLTADSSAILSVLAGLHGSMLGFVLAAFAIVLGYISKPRFKILRDAKQVENIGRIFLASIHTHAVSALVALSGLMLVDRSFLGPAVAWISCALLNLSVLRLLRVLWVTREILGAID